MVRGLLLLLQQRAQKPGIPGIGREERQLKKAAAGHSCKPFSGQQIQISLFKMYVMKHLPFRHYPCE